MAHLIKGPKWGIFYCHKMRVDRCWNIENFISWSTCKHEWSSSHIESWGSFSIECKIFSQELWKSVQFVLLDTILNISEIGIWISRFFIGSLDHFIEIVLSEMINHNFFDLRVPRCYHISSFLLMLLLLFILEFIFFL